MSHTTKLHALTKATPRGAVPWRRVLHAAIRAAEAGDDQGEWLRACRRLRATAREWWLNLPKTQ